MNEEQLWKGCMAELEMELPEPAFKTWLAGTRILERQGSVIKIGVKNAYAKNQLENQYYLNVKSSLDRLTGNKNIVKFIINKVEITVNEDSAKNQGFGPLFKPDSKIESVTPLQKNYTFENYIVGANNNIAFAVAQAVSQNPGQAHNPFFLYAPVGLGKTHLIQAIGNYIQKNKPSLKVIYCTAEEFTNELVESIIKPTQGKNTVSFRKKFRQVDVLLIDDIHFIAGRDSTQEEFFNTFNSLYLKNKQIVLTSDRPPEEIKKLEKRLTSRFASGMIADIQTPDIDVRKAILLYKVQEKGLNLSNTVLEILAQRVTTNIRELEGVLNQVITVAKTLNKNPDQELVESLLSKRAYGSSLENDSNTLKGNIDPQVVIQKISSYYQVSKKELLGKGRTKQTAYARQVAMFLLRTKIGCTLNQVGDILGGRDHSTVIHAVDKVSKLYKDNPNVSKQIREITQSIN